MTTPIEYPAAVVDPSGVVVTDIPCRKCGYNLRALNISGLCPECGTPIGRSVAGDFLRFSDPSFVRKLRLGIRLILWGLAAVILAVAGAVTLNALAVAAARAAPGAPRPNHLLLMRLCGIPGTALCLIGSWLLTTPDPSGLGESNYGTARRLVRICLLVSLASQFLFLLYRVRNDLVLELAGLVAIVAYIFSLVGLAAQLVYLRKLAQRIPDYSLAARAGTVLWGFVVCGVLFIAGEGMLLIAAGPKIIQMRRAAAAGFAPPAAGQLMPMGAMAGLGCAMALVMLALLIFFLLYVRMLYNFGRRFAEAAEQGDQFWAQHSAPAS